MKGKRSQIKYTDNLLSPFFLSLKPPSTPVESFINYVWDFKEMSIKTMTQLGNICEAFTH